MTKGVRMTLLLFDGTPVSREAMNSLIELASARLIELTVSGFVTNQVFEIDYFRAAHANRAVVMLTSQRSGTNYGFVVRPGPVPDRFVHVAHVETCGNLLDKKNWHMMTLTCGNRGQIIALPGW